MEKVKRSGNVANVIGLLGMLIYLRLFVINMDLAWINSTSIINIIIKDSDILQLLSNCIMIFDTNDHSTYVEVLVIDYDDNIHVDIKYEGEKENLEHLKNSFPDNIFKFAEVLGFNTVEYVMDK